MLASLGSEPVCSAERKRTRKIDETTIGIIQAGTPSPCDHEMVARYASVHGGHPPAKITAGSIDINTMADMPGILELHMKSKPNCPAAQGDGVVGANCAERDLALPGLTIAGPPRKGRDLGEHF
jgi:hypothetical protein